MLAEASHKLSLLALVPQEVGYFVAPEGWYPVFIGGTKTMVVTEMPDKACLDCPLSAYSHVLRAIDSRSHIFEKLCTMPFLRDKKLSLKAVMRYQGCGAKDSDYAQAMRLLGRVKNAA